MKRITLIVRKRKTIYTYKFNTVTEAYHYYLKKFSTFGDWIYYLRCAHKLLNHVNDEHIMECIFRNVFDENVYLLLDNG